MRILGRTFATYRKVGGVFVASIHFCRLLNVGFSFYTTRKPIRLLNVGFSFYTTRKPIVPFVPFVPLDLVAQSSTVTRVYASVQLADGRRVLIRA